MCHERTRAQIAGDETSSTAWFCSRCVTGIDHAADHGMPRERVAEGLTTVLQMFLSARAKRPRAVDGIEAWHATDLTATVVFSGTGAPNVGFPLHRHVSRAPALYCWTPALGCMAIRPTLRQSRSKDRKAGPNGRRAKSQVFYEVPRPFVTEESQALECCSPGDVAITA